MLWYGYDFKLASTNKNTDSKKLLYYISFAIDAVTEVYIDNIKLVTFIFRH